MDQVLRTVSNLTELDIQNIIDKIDTEPTLAERRSDEA